MGDAEQPDRERGPTPKADPIRCGEPNQSSKTRKGADLPPAGPHDDPSLTNPDATPGTGSLPSPDEQDSDSTSG